MTFERLNRWDWVAFLAALALVLASAIDWYSTDRGEEARRIERIAEPSGGALSGEIPRNVRPRAAEAAEAEERNAWQPAATIDSFVLLLLLSAFGLAVAAAFFRAAGRRFEPPFTPSAMAGVAAAVGGLLIAIRIVDKPGFDNAATLKLGAPLAAALMGVIAYASARALREEEEGRAFREVPAREAAESEAAAPEPEPEPR